MDSAPNPLIGQLRQQLQEQSTEQRLALALIPYPLRDEEKQNIRDLCSQITNWQEFLFWVVRHRINAMALENLTQAHPENVPSLVWEKLKQVKRRASLRIMQLLGQNINLSNAFAAQGIPYSILKGPVLSYQLFNRPDLRSTGDIDILIRPQEVERAEELILSSGYQRQIPAEPLTSKQRAMYLTHFHHFTYHNPQGLYLLEVHWALREHELISPQATDQIFQRLENISLASTRIKTLSPEDAFIFTLMQGTTDQWNCGKLFVDVLGWLRRSPDINWAQIAEIFQRERLGRIAAQTFGLVQAIWGDATPAAIKSTLPPHPEITPIATPAAQALFEKRPSVPIGRSLSRLKMLQYTLQLKPSWNYQRNIIFSLAQNSRDWHDFPLPDQLFFLYPLLRPFLWAVRRKTTP
jgi:hypothetical protein